MRLCSFNAFNVLAFPARVELVRQKRYSLETVAPTAAAGCKPYLKALADETRCRSCGNC